MHRTAPLFHLLLAFWIFTTGSAKFDKSVFSEVDWTETYDSFVPYPWYALAALPDELNHDFPPVELDLITNVAQRDEPLFALVKGIVARNARVLARHHFLIHPGRIWNHETQESEKCRQRTGTDPTTGEDITEAVDSENCAKHCTNEGRYCLNPTRKQQGRDLVEESARRVCFNAAYATDGTLFFEYMDHFHVNNCHDAADMTTCSYGIMDNEMKGKVNKKEVNDCIQTWGGLDEGVSEILEKAIMDEKLSGIRREDHALPVLEIDGHRYKGDFHVKQLFKAVCDAFPSGVPKPFACEYCGACTDSTQKCLWYIECNGESFDAVAYFGDSPPTNNGSHPVETFLIFLNIGVAVLFVLYGLRQYRTWQLMSELETSQIKIMDDDDEEEELDFRHHGPASEWSGVANADKSPPADMFKDKKIPPVV